MNPDYIPTKDTETVHQKRVIEPLCKINSVLKLKFIVIQEFEENTKLVT
jgi:hypothetical protein